MIVRNLSKLMITNSSVSVIAHGEPGPGHPLHGALPGADRGGRQAVQLLAAMKTILSDWARRSDPFLTSTTICRQSAAGTGGSALRTFRAFPAGWGVTAAQSQSLLWEGRPYNWFAESSISYNGAVISNAIE